MGKSKKKRAAAPQYNPTQLRAWREKANLTQEELAEKAQTTGATISRLERGGQPYGQVLFERIARVLGCKVSDLVDRSPAAAEPVVDLWASLSDDSRQYALGVLRTLKDRDNPS